MVKLETGNQATRYGYSYIAQTEYSTVPTVSSFDETFDARKASLSRSVRDSTT